MHRIFQNIKSQVRSSHVAPATNANVTSLVSFINCAPTQRYNDVVNISNHPVLDIKIAQQLNIKITLVLKISRSESGINVDAFHVKVH